MSLSHVWFLKAKPWGLALTAVMACHASYAATLGHSRLVSALGQPLRIDVQVTGLTQDEIGNLLVRPAAQSDWTSAGLTPPVPLSSLKVGVVDGYSPGTKIIQIRSSQAFDKPIADMLLDVRTSTGQQRYQVSLLTQARETGRQVSSGATAATSKAAGRDGSHPELQPVIRVRRGDIMFSIAQRHAVKGVTVFQMMMALQRANPQAFIEANVNLVKAGARLKMPDMAALTAISDKEARRLFQEQAQAFALYRQRHGARVNTVGDKGTPASGLVSSGGEGPVTDTNENGPRDQLRLSADAKDKRADDKAATRGNIDESVARVSQLEENVKHLNKALQAQGGAASSLLMEGARTLSDTLASATPSSDGSGSAGSVAEGASGKNGASGTSGESGASSTSSTSGTGTSGTGTSGTGTSGKNGAGGTSGTSGAGSTSGANGTGSSSGISNTANSDGNATSSDKSASAARAAPDGASVTTADAAGTTADRSSVSPAAAAAAATRSHDQASHPGSVSGSSETGSRAQGDAAGDAAPNSVGSSAASATPSADAGGHAAAGDAGGQGGVDSTSGIQSRSGAASASGEGGVDKPHEANGASPPGAAAANGSAKGPDISTSKAGQTVSWFQEHTLGVITGILALIVLIIAWLLRRANSTRSDGRDGVITETMVQEKLDQINLDLESSPDSTRSPRS